MTPVLPNLVVAGVVAGLGLFIAIRRPPRALLPALPCYLFFVLLYLAGDAITLVSRDMRTEQAGIAVLYTGSMWAVFWCWVLALRYCELPGGRAFARRRDGIWLGLPLAGTGLAWLVMLGNPWHGQFLTPVIGGPNTHLPLWYPLVGVGYTLAAGSILLYVRLAREARDPQVRRNAWIMAGGILLNLTVHVLYSVLALPFDPTVASLGAQSTLFLYGAYRTRLFLLFPVAHREIIRHDSDGVVLMDPEGRCLQSNPAAVALLGAEFAREDLDVPEALARRLRNAADGVLDRDALAARLLSPGPGETAELGPLRGGSRWLRIAVAPIPGRDGRAAAVSLRVRDVSEQQEAEAALKRARDALEAKVAERSAEIEAAVAHLRGEIAYRLKLEGKLRASEERYRAISELSSDLSYAFRVDRRGRLTWEWCTQAVEQMTGYSIAELTEREWWELVLPEDRPLIRSQMEPARRGGVVDLEIRIRTKQGATRWLETHARADPDPETGGLRAVGAVRDVTERRNAEAERRRFDLRVQEAQRLESLGVLAGGIAHDFNNLLAVILGNTDLAGEDLASQRPGNRGARAGEGEGAGAPGWGLEARLERIRTAAEYALKLTDQMLSYAGNSAVTVAPVHLGSLALEMLDLLRASVSAKCEIETAFADPLPAVLGDATQLRQVIMNLVTNAAEALGEQGGRVTLRTGEVVVDRATLDAARSGEAAEPGPHVFVEVADPGPGMDAATSARIFEPFFTTKLSGRGLGLAAVHGIVRAHGGAIELSSEPGRGTTFRVLLPRADESAARREPPPPPERPRDDASHRGASVLIVDDDDAVRDLACEFLERQGFRVLEARGGTEALRIAADSGARIDAVVLDLGMPDLDGEQTLAGLRRARPGLRVIPASGYGERLARERFSLAADLEPFLAKPYAPEDLVERVRNALDPSQLGG